MSWSCEATIKCSVLGQELIDLDLESNFWYSLILTGSCNWLPGWLLTECCHSPSTVWLAATLAFTTVLVCNVCFIRKCPSEERACFIIVGVKSRRLLKTSNIYLNRREERRAPFSRRCEFEPSQHPNPAFAFVSVNSVVIIQGPKDGPLHVL